MIFSLIVILGIVIFLAFFVGNNLSNVCTLWFFKTFENMPVAMLVFISFAVGIVFSILCFFIGYLKRKSVPTEDLTPEQKITELQRIKAKEDERKARLLEKQKRDQERQAQKSIKETERQAKLDAKKAEEIKKIESTKKEITDKVNAANSQANDGKSK